MKTKKVFGILNFFLFIALTTLNVISALAKCITHASGKKSTVETSFMFFIPLFDNATSLKDNFCIRQQL